MAKLPLGISDFEFIRRSGYRFVDKSMFIHDILNRAAGVHLITRPRRFGKTLNLSMMDCFLRSDPEKRRELFGDLAIAKTQHMDRPQAPVVFFSLKDLKRATFEQFLSSFGQVMATVYRKFTYLRDSLDPWDLDEFDRIIYRKADTVGLHSALSNLISRLQKHHDARVIVLIDEYDTPIHAAWSEGYYAEVIDFLRSFLGSALKDNTCLEKGVLTGILRVSKASIFSDLNNLDVHTVLDKPHNDQFGFSEQEVQDLLTEADAVSKSEVLQQWYNGYSFGGQVIYNPWSVVYFLSNDQVPKPYWVNTSSNQLIHDLLSNAPAGIHERLSDLLEDQTLSAKLSENLTFKNLATQAESLWTLLVFSGYLTTTPDGNDGAGPEYQLKIPNREIKTLFRDVFQDWYSAHYGKPDLDDLLRGLIRGEIEIVQRRLTHLVKTVLSYYDTGGAQPERVYHLFVLGMLVSLSPRYQIRSNRESGYGRYDILMRPVSADDPGIILEFKTFEDDNPQPALDAAKAQLRRRDYAAELRDSGVTQIHQYAAACNGKLIAVDLA